MTLVLENVGRTVAGEMYLEGISLTLAPGSLTLLLGPTLAGKTSLLRIIAGLDEPSSGRITLDGRDITRAGLKGRNVAMVYQQFVNYPSFTVYENIASPLRQRRGLGGAEIDRKVRAAAEMMRIEPLLKRLPAQLSGGQQQRTAIARALVKEADLLLMDEPLVNLDYKLREELRSEMRAIFGTGRTAVVYATTEPQEALLLGGSTAVLDAGRLLQFGTTLEVYARPATTRVGAIFSDPPMNLLPATVERGTDALVRLASGQTFLLPWQMRNVAAGTYQLGIRANHLGLAPRGRSDIRVPAVAELAEISGSATYLHARHGAILLVAEIPGVHSFAVGDPVTLFLEPGRLFAFAPDGRLLAAPGHSVALAGAA